MQQPASIEDLPFSYTDLIALLDDLGVSYEITEHEPVFTVAEGLEIERDIQGVHCRNLFLRDKKKAMFLVTLPNEREVDLKKLADLLRCARLSLGSSERLWEHLGIRPGSVNPFCVVNDPNQNVQLILDEDMMSADLVNYHPMDNSKTITLSPTGLLRVIAESGHKPKIIDLRVVAP